VEVVARRRRIGSAGIGTEWLEDIERRHAGKCMTASTAPLGAGERVSDAGRAKLRRESAGPAITRYESVCA
jgi:hypothetical protein